MTFRKISTGLAAALISLGAAGVAFAGDVRSGTFKGASNHITKGTVEVVEADGGGFEIHLKGDFWFDGAPDPRVGFGRDGTFVDATDFEVLRADTGAQVYKVPANIDPATFDDILIWCRKFSVPLGVAALN